MIIMRIVVLARNDLLFRFYYIIITFSNDLRQRPHVLGQCFTMNFPGNLLVLQ